MPPRTRREAPHRKDARIRKHITKAGEYWRQAPQELAQGDICQAGEKGWGAVAQIIKCIAAHRGWAHSGHEALLAVVRELADASPDPRAMRSLMGSAERLHGNFYEIHLDRADAEISLDNSLALLEMLWTHLPGEYRPAPTFAEWVERGNGVAAG